MRRPVFGLVVLTVLASGMVACSGRSSSAVGGWRGTIDTTSSGTVVVDNTGSGIWADSPRHLIVTLRIGRARGQGPAVFGDIAAVGIGPHGLLYALDGQAQEIRVFSRDGRFVRTIGRPGSGPGELQGALGFSWDPGGRLWVVDAGNGRYSVFDSTGVFLASHSRPLGVVHPWLGGFDGAGDLYDVSPGLTSRRWLRFTYYRIPPPYDSLESLPPLVYPHPVQPAPTAAFGLMPRLTFAFGPPGRLWFAATDAYRIYERTPAGDTTRIVELSRSPSSISAAQKDSIMAQARDERFPPGMFKRSDIPDTRPYFERIVAGRQGRIWVMTTAPSGGTSFDLFGRSGRYLGTLESPVPISALPPPAVDGDTLAGVATDSLGVQYLVRAVVGPGG